jgi:hypothetical protein
MFGATSARQDWNSVPQLGRFLRAGLMVLVLLLQSYATQTHIHKAAALAAHAALNLPAPPTHDKYPPGDDPVNCPICQQMAHAGQFIAPAWLLPLLVMTAVVTIHIVTSIVPHYDAVSHSWRGRGPPLH